MKLNSPRFGAWFSTFAYLLVAAIKVIIALQAASVALLADGLNNLTDIVTSVALIIGLYIAKKKRDDNHPYGHLRAENVASLLASFVIAMIGFQILFDTTRSIINNNYATPDPLASWIAFGSGAFMFIVYFINRNIASKANSQGLKAIAKDNFSDALVSIGTGIGILGAQLGLSWLDPITGVVIGLVILWAAWEIFEETSLILTDGINPDDIQKYKETISNIDEVESVKDIKARTSGSKVIIDVAITLPPNLTVKEVTHIVNKIKELTKEKHDSLVTLVETVQCK
ncbi:MULTISPECIES: cation diffusion facilitator family transporter [Halobacillus]|uniref:cation diffusion facilitator family transporter n=1 Tax=Halobacillus TaxID=45667 RepID=UPI0009A74918|nr:MULTISPECIES: cation diffusion facilitator family transporter [Halobacillus]